MNSIKLWRTCFLLLCTSFVFHLSAQDPGIIISGNQNEFLNDNWCIGWEFTANAPISITHLGIYDDNNQDGLNGPKEVGLYDSNKNLIASGVVPGGTAGLLVGQFRYIELVAPVTLTPGENYRVVGVHLLADGDLYMWTSNGTSHSTPPEVTYINDRFERGTTLTFPIKISTTGFDGVNAVGIFGGNFLFSNDPCVPGLPAGWTHANVGGATGDATYLPCEDLFCVESNGITSPNSDKIHYAYKPVCGNAEIVARVASISNGGLGGIMFRESLSGGSKKVALRSNLSYYVQRDTRTVTNGYHQTQQIFRPGHNWLKIKRTGNQFLGYTSTNGTFWQLAFFANVNMNACIYVGLFAEGPIDNVITEACFDNVSCLGGQIPLVDDSADNIAEQVRAKNAKEQVLSPAQNRISNPVKVEANNSTLEFDPTTNFEASLIISDSNTTGFNVFPNPTRGILNVNLEEYIGKDAQLFIYSSLGQNVKQVNLGKVQNPIERIALNGLNIGTYLIEVRTESETRTKKFIISGN